jgi:hypothetical protein
VERAWRRCECRGKGNKDESKTLALLMREVAAGGKRRRRSATANTQATASRR